MKNKTSIFLDLLRSVCATCVLLVHITAFNFSRGFQFFPEEAGHLCVIIFFLISGYVIAFVLSRGIDVVSYISDRLGRLWSAAIPAIILAGLVEIILNTKFGVGPYSRDHSIFRYISTSLFLNEVGLWSGTPLVIGPAWSLAYEFWYYILYAVIHYGKKKWVCACVLVLSIFAIPKIMLLFPVWLLGVVAFKINQSNQIVNKLKNYKILLIGLSFYVLYISSLFSFPYEVGKKPLYFSGAFISDFFFGIGCFLALITFNLGKDWQLPARLTKIIRAYANISFSLYLIHIPLITASSFLLNYDKNLPIITFLVFSIIILAFFFGNFFEPKRKPLALYIKNVINKYLDEKRVYATTINKIFAK